MKRRTFSVIAVLAAGAGLVAALGTGGGAAAAGPSLTFSQPTKIDNPYWPLPAGRRCEHRGLSHEGVKERSVKQVLDRTKAFQVGGQQVQAAVVEDRAFAGGRLVERTFDYCAQSDDGTVYYMGEDVTNYKRNGKVLDHHGTWLYGEHTDVPGVAMPPAPKVGDQWRFEDVPGITAESNRLEEAGMRAKAGGRLYTDVIRLQEFIQPEGEVEYKLYAPGVGLITEYPPDGRTELVRCA